MARRRVLCQLIPVSAALLSKCKQTCNQVCVVGDIATICRRHRASYISRPVINGKLMVY